MIAAAAAVAAVSLQPFRYERRLQPRGAGPVLLVPDGRLYAHTRADFRDLRVVDADGRQVPWRPRPEPVPSFERSLPVFDSGRRGVSAVARVDLGPGRRVVDRIRLDVPDARFVGSVTVFGSDDRRSWIRLGTTQIYSVGGALPARSTTAVFAPSDLRYLELRATHVTRITGATVAAAARPLRLVRRAARVRVTAPSTVVVDLGYPNVPVDELRVTSSTRRYDRAFTVTTGGRVVAAGRLVRLGRARATVVPLAVRTRMLRIRIENGDDPPLRGVGIEVLARPRTLVLEGGHPAPLTLYYGARVRPPVYDYARLPASALALGRARAGTLGPERANPHFRIVDTRSFFARHRAFVTAALALAAAAVIAAAAVGIRRA